MHREKCKELACWCYSVKGQAFLPLIIVCYIYDCTKITKFKRIALGKLHGSPYTHIIVSEIIQLISFQFKPSWSQVSVSATLLTQPATVFLPTTYQKFPRTA